MIDWQYDTNQIYIVVIIIVINVNQHINEFDSQFARQTSLEMKKKELMLV